MQATPPPLCLGRRPRFEHKGLLWRWGSGLLQGRGWGWAEQGWPGTAMCSSGMAGVDLLAVVQCVFKLWLKSPPQATITVLDTPLCVGGQKQTLSGLWCTTHCMVLCTVMSPLVRGAVHRAVAHTLALCCAAHTHGQRTTSGRALSLVASRGERGCVGCSLAAALVSAALCSSAAATCSSRTWIPDRTCRRAHVWFQQPSI